MKPSRSTLEAILRLDFSDADVARYEVLSAKAQLGTLSDAESAELDSLLTANDLLTILHAKAKSALDRE